MLPLIVLGLGIVCALASRVLLFIAAIRISARWAVGVFLPFGPLFFRLKYPIEARSSMLFRYLTLIFFGFYLIEGARPQLYHFKQHKPDLSLSKGPRPGDMLYYGTEKAPAVRVSAPAPAPAPVIVNLEARRAANDTELERLRDWYESLRVRKRDLLHSDVVGTRIYIVDLALYNDALAKAMVERNTLDAATKHSP